VAANIECITNSVNTNVILPLVFYVMNPDCDLFDLIKQILSS